MVKLYLLSVCLVIVMVQKGNGNPRQLIKPGYCPVIRKPMDHVCAVILPPDACTGDIDCPGNKKCCRGRCYRECLDPVSRPPKGGCPPRGQETGKPCLKIPQASCKSNDDCKNGYICCFVGCYRECVSQIF